jgi:hypothetical protein
MSDSTGIDVEATPPDRPHRRSLAPLFGVLFGMPILGFGVWSAFSDRKDTHPFELARWVIAFDLAHDLIAAPIIVTVAWLVGRWVPAKVRAPLRFALGASGVLALYSWPFLRGYGRNASVPSLLNRNYATGLTVYLVVVWLIAAMWAGVMVVRSRGPINDHRT